MVAVVDDNSLVRNRKVTTLRAGGDFVYVSSGLDDGDRVILTALDSALTGAAVDVVSTVSSAELRRQHTTQPRAPAETAAAPDLAGSP
jgi:hypothetical protein